MPLNMLLRVMEPWGRMSRP